MVNIIIGNNGMFQQFPTGPSWHPLEALDDVRLAGDVEKVAEVQGVQGLFREVERCGQNMSKQ